MSAADGRLDRKLAGGVANAGVGLPQGVVVLSRVLLLTSLARRAAWSVRSPQRRLRYFAESVAIQ